MFLTSDNINTIKLNTKIIEKSIKLEKMKIFKE